HRAYGAERLSRRQVQLDLDGRTAVRRRGQIETATACPYPLAHAEHAEMAGRGGRVERRGIEPVPIVLDRHRYAMVGPRDPDVDSSGVRVPEGVGDGLL